MTDWVVTANLAGPFARSEVRAATCAWGLDALARKPAMAFFQELPSDDWLAPWTSAGYRPTFGISRGWRVRSVLLTRGDLDVSPATVEQCPKLEYHGDYVAAATWHSARGPVVLASVHASPNPAEPEKYGWPGALPEARNGGGDRRYPGATLWDSDLVLATLEQLSNGGQVPLLAAGDLNEAVGFDVDERGDQLGTWGAEYFENARGAGLIPWLSDTWRAERPTRGAWQLDHLLQSRAAEGLLAKEPEPHLDPLWASSNEAGRSDHTPIWAALNSSWLTA